MSVDATIISRRRWLASVWNPPRTAERGPDGDPEAHQVAVIQGRRCLAYRSLFCSTCVERCPVEGAIVVKQGIPRIVASACTGCGECRQVCPAPENAVLMIPKPTGAEER